MPGFPRLASLAVTLRGDDVLLVRRRNQPDAGLWGFPGGHVEPGETALQCAARELAEETGVIATPRLYLDNIDVIRHDAQGMLKHHYLLTAVLCDYVLGEPVAGDDALDAGWVPFPDVLAESLPLSDHVGRILRRAIDLRGGS